MATSFIVENDGLAAEHGKAWQPDVDALPPDRDRPEQLIRRLLVGGSDALALHVYRRLRLDRRWTTTPCPGGTLTWTEIAQWGFQEGLLDPQERRLVEWIPLSRP
jgi:hypothetical protein